MPDTAALKQEVENKLIARLALAKLSIQFGGAGVARVREEAVHVLAELGLDRGNGEQREGLMLSKETSRDIRLKPCKQGVFLYSNREVVGNSLDKFGEWDEPLLEILLPLLEAGDVVVDVGAHIGTYSVPFAKIVGSLGGVVHAFEPQRLTFQLLNANLALNSVTNAITYNIAITYSKAD